MERRVPARRSMLPLGHPLQCHPLSMQLWPWVTPAWIEVTCPELWALERPQLRNQRTNGLDHVPQAPWQGTVGPSAPRARLLFQAGKC